MGEQGGEQHHKNENMQELCRKEFGFELEDLKRRVHSHAELEKKLHEFCSEALQSADPKLRRELGSSLIMDMCSISKRSTDHLLDTMMKMQSTISKNMQAEKDLMEVSALAYRSKQTLEVILARVSSDLAFLRSQRASREKRKAEKQKTTVEKKKDMLDKELASCKAISAADRIRFEDEKAELEAAVQRLESEKANAQDKARTRFEEEKILLETALREEMQACQICLLNPRNVVILPCFHGQFCEDCLEAHRKINKTCPTCRITIRGTHPYIA